MCDRSAGKMKQHGDAGGQKGGPDARGPAGVRRLFGLGADSQSPSTRVDAPQHGESAHLTQRTAPEPLTRPGTGKELRKNGE